MVIFYQNNSEGSFDGSLREPETTSTKSLLCGDCLAHTTDFHWISLSPNLPAGKFDPTPVSVKMLFTRILKLLASPTFEYDISMEMTWFYRN